MIALERGLFVCLGSQNNDFPGKSREFYPSAFLGFYWTTFGVHDNLVRGGLLNNEKERDYDQQKNGRGLE